MRAFGWGRRDSEDPEPVRDLDFPAAIAREFPALFPAAWRAVEQTLAAVNGADLSPLARRSPALEGYDWTAYLRCSVVRMVRALAALHRAGALGGRLLDYGSYFGNFALACRTLGYEVVAADAYREYGTAFDRVRDLLRDAGVQIDDFADAGPSGARFDAIVALGVLEHVPHTPRPLLEALDRRLEAGGVLVLDTPNLGYLYTREKLARGESIFPPIERQFYTELPFEGHHREYLPREVKWMLEAIGHTGVEIETFNYSVYALGAVRGADVARLAEMDASPELREIILSCSRRPAA
ncbi:MAG TPA: class I SAM-dependent methyltransferase [Vicinamibacterales bacterium]|nr:class I SAM-dependent methyltransferase [Vicinamibacterales bacterium]